MPVFVVDGRRFRVPFVSLFKSNSAISRELQLAFNNRKVALKPVTASLEAPEIASPTIDGYKSANKDGAFPWSVEEDRLLRELKAYRMSWNRIAIAMGDRTIEELKRRWTYLQNSKSKKNKEITGFLLQNGSDCSIDNVPETSSPQGVKPERHVSFSDPLVTAGDLDDEEHSNLYPKVTRVFYIDDEFTLEDVILLHTIAAKWECDRWLAISTRFNDMTGRRITPEQAKSVFKK